ncbi:cupin domain-containing protein [Anaerobium acetethylicum]|uniref:Cupin domain protein n=1 Tax=Anaerobium acetethylicum TaxID=1619234 RepID=A0A1D3TTJ3_9FIRM|nr:cupin domain-containing protein [Anaerobium acetethylicum]SCP97269.1 Cupin domain protein [Anaerobium acetethylicum]
MENAKNKIMKNIKSSTPMELKDLVNYQDGQVVSKTLAQNPHVSLTLFAFDQGEEISTHSSHGDAMVYVIDGTAEITIGEEQFQVPAGQTILMPAEVPHAVSAPEKMKFMLTVIF